MTEVPLDAERALAEAERRVRKLPEIVASAERSDGEAMSECLAAAAAVVREHAAPKGVYAAYEAALGGRELHLGQAKVSNFALTQRVRPGQRVLLYLATTGYTNMRMMEAVGGDYIAYHFQHYLSLQLLYAAANLLHAEILRREGGGFVRFSILEGPVKPEGEKYTERADGRRMYWDAQAIAALFAGLAPNPIGVSLTETGGMNPVYSLLGVMVPRREGERDEEGCA